MVQIVIKQVVYFLHVYFSLKGYTKKKRMAEIGSTLMGQLSETEKFLFESQDLIETRGKVGRLYWLGRIVDKI